MEPFFTVVLSAFFLGEKPTVGVMLTLLPIVGGVVVASMSEVRPHFHTFGPYLQAMTMTLQIEPCQTRLLLRLLLLLPAG